MVGYKITLINIGNPLVFNNAKSSNSNPLLDRSIVIKFLAFNLFNYNIPYLVKSQFLKYRTRSLGKLFLTKYLIPSSPISLPLKSKNCKLVKFILFKYDIPLAVIGLPGNPNVCICYGLNLNNMLHNSSVT